MTNAEREGLFAELEFHKLEYTSLCSEMSQRREAQRQSLNLSLVAIGAAFGFFPVILEQKIFISLLLYPLIFHVFFQQMLSSSKRVWQISSYISYNLIPRVNHVLDKLGDKRDGIMVLGWESEFIHLRINNAKRITSISPAKRWLPILTVIGLLVSYLALVNSSQYSVSLIEITLFLGNVLFLVLVVLQGRMTARVEVRKTQKLTEIKSAIAGQEAKRKNKQANLPKSTTLSTNRVPTERILISVYVGFVTSWAVATTLTNVDIAIRYLYQWGVIPLMSQFVYLEALSYNLAVGLGTGFFQWIILVIYLKNDIFFPSTKSFSPPLHWWIIATVTGYLLQVILYILVYDWLLNIFLQNQLMLRLVPNILEQILLSACQWVVLQKWLGKNANIWFIPTILATIIETPLIFYLGVDPLFSRLIAGSITGFGMLLIAKMNVGKGAVKV
jgi:hypothetical protein